MSVPNHLYLYQSLADGTHSLENLKNKCVWLANPRVFNDIYDCSSPVKCPKDKEWIVRHKRANLRNRYQVVCFSERFDNHQLWSHYADHHRGFCIGFDRNSAPFSDALKVDYDNEPLEVDESYFDLDNQELEERLVLKKSKDRDREEEWRIVRQIPKGSYFSPQGERLNYDLDCVKTIYLGAKIGPCEKVQIYDILEKWPYKDVLQMRPGEDTFRLIPHKVNYTK